MRALVFVLLATGIALVAGGPVLAYLGYTGAQARLQAYVQECTVPGTSSSCAELRGQVRAADTQILEGLILAFVGADLLVLALLFHVSPAFRRLLPAPH